MIAQHLPVVCRKQDERVVPISLPDRVLYLSHLVINQLYIGVVAGSHAIPVFLCVAAAAFSLRRSGAVDDSSVIPAVIAVMVNPVHPGKLPLPPDSLRQPGPVDSVCVLLRGVEWEMGTAEGNPGKQRFLLIVPADRSGGLISHPCVGMPAGRPRKRKHLLVLRVPYGLPVRR